ncbi:MerR family transcriptional regulator [Paenibacillus xylanexedens]|uniref:MerR family transcriptional regulator n=1 Tax=Paenibacillus xylanexedens TaxID=528191 RepID=UPI0021B40911|nr:MerR family transcriptional regulator [Paenibacillus xylanexedens]
MNANKEPYSIGEAAKLIGSTVKTIRYYDEIELLQPSSHTEGGHRLYTTQDLWQLELITTLRYLNFSIPDIRKLMSGELAVAQALDLQIEALETQIGTMNSMLSILQQAKQHEEETSLHSLWLSLLSSFGFAFQACSSNFRRRSRQLKRSERNPLNIFSLRTDLACIAIFVCNFQRETFVTDSLADPVSTCFSEGSGSVESGSENYRRRQRHVESSTQRNSQKKNRLAGSFL